MVMHDEIHLPLEMDERDDGVLRYKLLAIQQYVVPNDWIADAAEASKAGAFVKLVMLLGVRLDSRPGIFRHIEVVSAIPGSRQFAWGYYQVARSALIPRRATYAGGEIELRDDPEC